MNQAILESNVLIAKFLGREGKYDKKLYTFKSIGNLIDDAWVSPEDMKFHSSWDWLMVVIDKISDIKLRSLNVTLNWLSDAFGDGLYNFDEVYNVVIKYIVYYNKSK